MDDARVGRDIISPSTRLASSAGSYIRCFLGGVITTLAALAALYGGIAQTEYLPPPPLSNNLCVDEKLAFLRDHPPHEPDFLVAGSSIAWRNIDSSVLARTMPGSRPVNGAFCGMQIHRAAMAAEWLIEQWPSIDDVLLVTGPQDFISCSDTAMVFDLEDASRFVFEREEAWSFYLRYFDPVSFVRNAVLRAKKPNDQLTQARATALTTYGDGPLKSRGSKLGFGHLPRLDQRCFDALRSFAQELSREKRELMVVATPLNPRWKAVYDAAGTDRNGFAQDVSNALAGTGAKYWNADEAGAVALPEAFYDAIHMRWFAANIFTEQVLREIHRRNTRSM
jgi:hypothetical protein